MNYENSKLLFSRIEIKLGEQKYTKFCLYEDLLLNWNKVMNLTAITDDNEIWLKHFIDSCTIAKYIDNNSSLIDVGTGAGFPSIPLKIINNSINITMLDSLNKRISFLKDVCEKLDLNQCSFIHGRAEDCGQMVEYREKFDFVTARAVANLSTLSELCLPFIKVGGKFICMKAGNCDEEIENAKKAIKLLGGKISQIDNIKMDDFDYSRTIIIIEKVKETPRIYPRKAGIPSKNPL